MIAITELLTPETIIRGARGEYKIIGMIGRGGMGAVYRAKQLRPERDVALKILLPQFAEDDEMLARFQIEAGAMAQQHSMSSLPRAEVEPDRQSEIDICIFSPSPLFTVTRSRNA